MPDTIQVKRLPITPELRDFVFNRDGYVCRYCGSEKQPFHLDHVYPVSKGGETTVENLVTSCSSCNLKKHSSVGMWPKPIGYFDTQKITNSESMDGSHPLHILDAILMLVAMFGIVWSVNLFINHQSELGILVLGISSGIVIAPVLKVAKENFRWYMSTIYGDKDE